MQTPVFVDLMQQLAPLELAESWDNVGVLVDRGTRREVSRVFLTIDLTWAVLQEALAARADVIVAYHPPIFGGVKRIVPSDPKSRVLGEVLARDIIVYSPHTALDSVPSGVNDWLLDAFETTSRKPVSPFPGALTAAGLPDVSAPGQGRVGELAAPVTLDAAVEHIKRHLGLSAVRRSAGAERGPGSPNLVRSVAVCAGAGGALLAKCRADLLVTGEMRHHDVLELQELGTSVILTDHTNCERGYLPFLRGRITQLTSELEVFVSAVDSDPLQMA